jgi:hypothetical protein
MRAITLRRTGFVATLITGLLLTASAVSGVSGMDSTLELAARTPERPVLVSHHEPGPGTGECERYRDDRDRRLT